jgi:tetratricopeptide (TPR) repeat protein
VIVLAGLLSPAAFASPADTPSDPFATASLQDPPSTAVLSEAERLFRAGQFRGLLGLEDAGVAPDGAATLAVLKARSALAEAFRVGLWPNGEDWIEMAQAHAEAARRLDPGSHEAALLLATALGLTARSMGDLPVFAAGLPGKTRMLLEEAVALAPEDGQVLAALAAWHLDVVARAGPDLGQSLFGADLEEGLSLLRSAGALAPTDVAVQFEVGVALLTLDAARYRAEAETALENAQSSVPADGFEAIVQDKATALLQLIRTGGDRDALRKRLASLQGYRTDPS